MTYTYCCVYSSILMTLASSHHNLYDLYLLLCVQCYTPDDGQRYCPKHVEFYSKNKFEKLVHLVGFMIRRRHDKLIVAFSNFANVSANNTAIYLKPQI